MKKTWLGDVEHLDTFESFITPDDAGQLRDYFRIGGSSRFCKSRMGAMLDNAKMFSPNLAPCLACGGTRYKNKGDKEESGSGFVGDDTCTRCQGSGWENLGRHAKGEITARPNKMAQHGARHSIDIDVQIGTCAIVESILDRADVLLPIATQVLSSVYGRRNHGLLGAWHITPAGKKLFRSAGDKEIEPEQYFVALREENNLRQDENMKKQFESADRDAAAAIEYAGRAWNAASFVRRCGV
jgi:hypothetical protein